MKIIFNMYYEEHMQCLSRTLFRRRRQDWEWKQRLFAFGTNIYPLRYFVSSKNHINVAQNPGEIMVIWTRIILNFDFMFSKRN